MSTKPVLTYFNLPAKGAGGRAGFIRLALAYAGWDYEDVRLTFAEWPQHKANQPLKQLPVFEYQGQKFTQSWAILRFIGGETGTYPSGVDRLKVDELIDTMNEMFAGIPQGDKDQLQSKREEYVAGKLNDLLTYVNRRIGEHGGPFATGKNVTIADFALVGVIKMLQSGFYDHIPANLSEKYENVSNAVKATLELPKIAEFFKNHDC